MRLCNNWLTISAVEAVKMYELLDDLETTGRELRKCVVESLIELIGINEKVVALESDLGGASYFTKIQKEVPANFIQVGIEEANMIGVAAGLSLVGFVPFVHTFGPFATRRCLDQIYLAGAYSKNTINIYGSDPGYCVGPNGGTHTTWEDVALLRSIPDVTICDGADDTQVAWIVKQFASMEGIHYLRANRKAVYNIYKEGSTFEIGKGNLLCPGQDILIITSGILVKDALEARLELEQAGYSVAVIDMFTIKPLDIDLILEQAQDKKIVVTFENHSIIGGLGTAVSEVIAENNIDITFKRIGVNDCFGQVGTPEFLKAEYRLTSANLVEQIHILLNRKEQGI